MGAGIGVGASGVIMLSILLVDARGAQDEIAKVILSMLERNVVIFDGVLFEASPQDAAKDGGLRMLFAIFACD